MCLISSFRIEFWDFIRCARGLKQIAFIWIQYGIIYTEGETVCLKTLLLFGKQYFYDKSVENKAILIVHYVPEQLHKELGRNPQGNTNVCEEVYSKEISNIVDRLNLAWSLEEEVANDPKRSWSVNPKDSCHFKVIILTSEDLDVVEKEMHDAMDELLKVWFFFHSFSFVHGSHNCN